MRWIPILERHGTGERETSCPGWGCAFVSKETNEETLRAARADTTDGASETRGRNTMPTVWLVGAEGLLYTAWLGVYSWQLLRGVVGPVARRDLAG
jgi:hypothetical protein